MSDIRLSTGDTDTTLTLSAVMMATTVLRTLAATPRVGASMIMGSGAVALQRNCYGHFGQGRCHRTLSVWILAGEPSGDAIGARLLIALTAEAEARGDPVTAIGGVGGPGMLKAGLRHSLFPMEEISVMGAWELLPHLSRLRRRLHEAATAVTEAKPDVLITVDSKGFAFRLVDLVRSHSHNQESEQWQNRKSSGRHTEDKGGTGRDNRGEVERGTKDHGIGGLAARSSPVCVHYVSPSWWAYRGGEARLKGLQALGIDRVLCLLPFEPSALCAAGVPAQFVGHPVVEDLAEARVGRPWLEDQFRDQLSESPLNHGAWDVGEEKEGGGPVLALLPGSREQELRRHLPLMREMSALLAARRGGGGRRDVPAGTRVMFLALPQHVDRLAHETATWPLPAHVVPSEPLAARAAAFASTAAAVTAAGTASAQLFAHGVPQVVTYRAHPLSELAALAMARTAHAALPNIVLGREVVPELLGFSRATPGALADEVASLLRCAQDGGRDDMGAGTSGDGDRMGEKEGCGGGESARAQQLAARREFIAALTPDAFGTMPSVVAARAILDAVDERRERNEQQ